MIELPITVEMAVEGDAEYEMDVESSFASSQTSVKGSFTTGEAGTVQTISIPYDGDSYPVMLMIQCDGGFANTESYWFTTNQRYTIGMFTIMKRFPQVAPDYYVAYEEKSYNAIEAIIKSNSSTTGYSTAQNDFVGSYTQSLPTSSFAHSVKLPSSTEMKIFVASTSYGFLPNCKYNYWVVYYE